MLIQIKRDLRGTSNNFNEYFLKKEEKEEREEEVEEIFKPIRKMWTLTVCMRLLKNLLISEWDDCCSYFLKVQSMSQNVLNLTDELI